MIRRDPVPTPPPAPDAGERRLRHARPLPPKIVASARVLSPAGATATRPWPRLGAAAVGVTALVATSAWFLSAEEERAAVAPPPEPPAAAARLIEEPALGDFDPTRPPTMGRVRLTEFSMDIAESARRLVRAPRPPPGFRDDCSGFVTAILTDAGIPADGRVRDLWTLAEKYGALHWNPIPAVGDIAFFDNTYDRNDNGEWDDWRTHIAVVVDVAPDGTITLAHNGSKRALIHMNLLDPSVHDSDAGVEENSWLRRSEANDAWWTFHLTGELWAGFATVFPDRDWYADVLSPEELGDR